MISSFSIEATISLFGIRECRILNPFDSQTFSMCMATKLKILSLKCNSLNYKSVFKIETTFKQPIMESYDYKLLNTITVYVTLISKGFAETCVKGV